MCLNNDLGLNLKNSSKPPFNLGKININNSIFHSFAVNNFTFELFFNN